MAIQAQHRFFLLSVLFLVTKLSLGQKFEIRGNAYGGLFFFRGTGAVYTAKTGFNDAPAGYYSAYPYGKKSAFSYAVEPQMQRVTKGNFIYGIGIGYENLKSKVNVDSSYMDFGIRAVDQKIILVNQFVAFHPYIGRRFTFRKVTIDALAGVDFAYSKKVVARIEDAQGKYGYPEEKYPLDKRPRIEFHVNHERFGLSVGYSRGTKNLFHAGWSYLNKEARANYLRLGVNYKLASF